MQFAKLTPREVDAVKLSAMGSFLQGGGQTPGGGITTYRAASPSLGKKWASVPISLQAAANICVCRSSILVYFACTWGRVRR